MAAPWFGAGLLTVELDRLLQQHLLILISVGNPYILQNVANATVSGQAQHIPNLTRQSTIETFSTPLFIPSNRLFFIRTK